MRWARAWARPVATLAAALAAFAGPAATAHAAAAPPATSHAAAVDGPAPGARTASPSALAVDITDIAPAVLRPDQTLTVSGTVTNGTTEDLTAPTLRLRMQRSTPISRTTLQRWLEPDSVFSTVVVAREDLPERLPAGASTTFSFEVPAADLPLTDTSWGPRGIEVAVDDVAGDPVEATDRSFMLWYPNVEVQPTPVGVLAPVTATAAERTRAEGEGSLAAAAEPRVGPLLKALDRPGVTTFVDPMLLTGPSPRIGAAETPPGAEGAEAAAETEQAEPADQAVSDLRAAVAAAADTPDHEVTALPWADADVAALAHTGRQDLLDQALARSTAAVRDAGVTARTDVTWPAGVPDERTAELAAATGATAVVLPAGAMTPAGELTYTPSARTDIPLDDGSDLPAVLVDERASAVLSGRLLPRTAGSAAPAPLDDLTVRQLLLAETAVVARERPSDPRALVLALGRDFTGDAAALGQTLGALTSAPWVRPTTLDQLLALDASTLRRSPLPQEQVSTAELDAADLARMRAARNEAAAFATATTDPAAFLLPVDDALAPVLSAAWRADPAGREGLIRQVRRDVAGLSTAVTALPSSTLNLINSSANVPVHVRNDLDVDVTVRVELNPNDPRLQAREGVPLTVPAHSQATAQVPVRAVGSGDLPVRIELTTPAGHPVGELAELAVRVRADWENVGTAVVAGLLVVLLIAGLVRTVRRGPRMDPGTPVPDPGV
ncbi:DUF6049 family protein [Georgenia thermotolerans]|uniref:Glycoprotein n=1 Tax=Georgenia thermotolerans TaxID=527326 RepID=A0A7J5UJL5_9MICO|nr:DUF6049 family protein [Georgenia thermotolerans]KAE8762579.1 hypothetical protein GB883_18605 [Georgenia thermotolerans]